LCSRANRINRALEITSHNLLPPAPDAFVKALTPFCDALGFKALPAHLHVILGAAAFYQLCFLLSPLLSHSVPAYQALDRRSKINWDIHVVSMIQSIAICWLAYLALGDPKLLADRVFGYSAFAGDVAGLAVGYFVWDSYVSIRYVKLFGIGFALHGLASLAVFTFGLV
jgi:hypothetical protein